MGNAPSAPSSNVPKSEPTEQSRPRPEATSSQRPLTGPRSKIDIGREETERTVESIRERIKHLKQKYRDSYLSPNMCQRLALAGAKELKGVPLKRLKAIGTGLNNNEPPSEQLEAFLAYNPLEGEQFIVDDLRGRLEEHFADSTVPLQGPQGISYKGAPIPYLGGARGGAENEEGTIEDLEAMLNARLAETRNKIEKRERKKNINEELIQDLTEVSNKDKEIQKALNNKGASNKNKKELLVNAINNKRIRKCDEGEECHLTKAELCQRLAEHYTVRLNLALAIEKAVQGDGFCYKRYLALRDGRLCIPPNLEGLSGKRQLEEVTKYASHFSKSNCSDAGGLWRELSESELGTLQVSRSEFSKYYMDYIAKLQKQYQESVLQLLSLVEELEKMPPVGTQLLNELTAKAKEVIDSLYQACERNYIYATFAFVRADLDTQNRADDALSVFQDQ